MRFPSVLENKYDSLINKLLSINICFKSPSQLLSFFVPITRMHKKGHQIINLLSVSSIKFVSFRQEIISGLPEEKEKKISMR